MRSDPREITFSPISPTIPMLATLSKGSWSSGLLPLRIKLETRTVSEAITKLIAEGLIQEEKGSDARVVYRVHPDAHNIENIQERLSQIRSSLDDKVVELD